MWMHPLFHPAMEKRNHAERHIMISHGGTILDSVFYALTGRLLSDVHEEGGLLLLEGFRVILEDKKNKCPFPWRSISCFAQVEKRVNRVKTIFVSFPVLSISRDDTENDLVGCVPCAISFLPGDHGKRRRFVLWDYQCANIIGSEYPCKTLKGKLPLLQ